MAFKDRLKEARVKKGYTQEQIAEKVGIAKSTFTGYERGTREPNVNTIGMLMDELGVDANYLWQDEMGSNFPVKVSYDEMQHIEKYRALDEHGKEMVDFTLEKEYERSVEEKKKADNIVSMTVNESSDYEVNAAHADNYDAAPDDLKEIEENIMDDENFENTP